MPWLSPDFNTIGANLSPTSSDLNTFCVGTTFLENNVVVADCYRNDPDTGDVTSELYLAST